MSQVGASNHLTGISTPWTLFRQAHEDGDQARAARQRLLDLYGKAVKPYLFALARDPDVAEDLYQEFALLLVKGGFKNATPEKGRFRDYIRTCFRHMAHNYMARETRNQHAPLPDDIPASDSEPVEAWQRFLNDLRNSVLEQAWAALQAREAESGTPYHSVLRLKAEVPEATHAQLAEQLSLTIGRPFTEDGVRQLAHRAKDQFAKALLEAVANLLKDPTRESLKEELDEFGLLEYCRSSLEEWHP